MKNLNWLPWLVFLKDSNALGNCQRKKLGISPFVRALEEMSVIFEIFLLPPKHWRSEDPVFPGLSLTRDINISANTKVYTAPNSTPRKNSVLFDRGQVIDLLDTASIDVR